MKILSLDLSVKCSGYAKYDSSNLIDCGSVLPVRYKGHSKDRYPKKPTLFAMSVADQLSEIVHNFNPDIIYIEEATSGGIAGVKSIKSLIMLHGILLSQISDHLDKITFVKPSTWQRGIGVGGKRGDAQKQASVDFVNNMFDKDYKLEDNDITDAICLGHYATIMEV